MKCCAGVSQTKFLDFVQIKNRFPPSLETKVSVYSVMFWCQSIPPFLLSPLPLFSPSLLCLSPSSLSSPLPSLSHFPLSSPSPASPSLLPLCHPSLFFLSPSLSSLSSSPSHLLPLSLPSLSSLLSTQEEEKQKLQEELSERETKTRRRSLGNIRFIGELFKLKVN